MLPRRVPVAFRFLDHRDHRQRAGGCLAPFGDRAELRNGAIDLTLRDVEPAEQIVGFELRRVRGHDLAKRALGFGGSAGDKVDARREHLQTDVVRRLRAPFGDAVCAARDCVSAMSAVISPTRASCRDGWSRSACS